jgi:hypothetical protein
MTVTNSIPPSSAHRPSRSSSAATSTGPSASTGSWRSVVGHGRTPRPVGQSALLGAQHPQTLRARMGLANVLQVGLSSGRERETGRDSESER